MVKIPSTVTDKINIFLQLLAKNNIVVEQAILFGSYAKGTFDNYSDIDIALVSKAFNGNRFLDKNLLRKFIIEVSVDLEPLPFSVENFNEKDPFVKEILETGIKIIS